MSVSSKGLALSVFILLALGCSKDPKAPDATTQLTGHWITADTVEVFTGLDIRMVQKENGALSGNWVGKTRITNGRCDATFGCSPSNVVYGSNLSLRIDLEILGAGSFTGQLASKDVIQGQIIRYGTFYNLRLHRVN